MATDIESTRRTEENIIRPIYFLGHRVMIDEDRASLSQVPAKQQKDRLKEKWTGFPEDFMFELSGDEFSTLDESIWHLQSSGGLA